MNKTINYCCSLHLKAIWRPLWFEIRSYIGLFISYPRVYNPIFMLANSCYFMVDFYICIILYCSFKPTCFLINQLAPPSASPHCTRRTVVWGIHGHCCISAPCKSQSWHLYLTTLTDYYLDYCPSHLPNPLQITCYLAIPSFSPLEPCWHISSKLSWSNKTKCIQHCYNSAMATHFWMSPETLQPASPSGGVHLDAVLDYCFTR